MKRPDKYKRKGVFEFKPHIAGYFQVMGASTTESDVIGFVMEGLSNKEIADRMCVVEKSVKFHLVRIYKMFRVKSRAELIVKVARNGYFAESYNYLLQPAGIVKNPKIAKSLPSYVAPLTGPGLPVGNNGTT